MVVFCNGTLRAQYYILILQGMYKSTSLPVIKWINWALSIAFDLSKYFVEVWAISVQYFSIKH